MGLYLLLLGGPIILALLAQLSVSSAFKKYTKVQNSTGMTGAQAAHYMLRAAGLDTKVSIERVQGKLSDHYDPSKKVLRLSNEIHDNRSIAAVAVACHEAGHAIQDAKGYAPLVMRNAIVPMASFGSNAAFLCIILGIVLRPLLYVGVACFAVIALFQLINLPVEFDASKRAKAYVGELGLINTRQEKVGVAKMLNAAAMTYVAATVAAIAHLIYYAVVLASGE